jgi:uncharacterized protein (TIGR00299 family) protein
MSEGRFAILDPAAGISGDMLLGALVAAGAPREWLEQVPARLGFPGVTVRIREVERCSIRALKVDVVLPGGEIEQPAELLAHSHRDHDHARAHAAGDEPHRRAHTHAHGDAPHRHIGELIAIVERAPLSPWVRERAVRALRLLGEAEGRVHGQAPEHVALHEVGAMDALVDLVAGIEGFEQLGIEQVYNRPVAVGSGWVRAAHGTMAVPTPATALLLEGFELAEAGPVEGEATTPTGAVLLRVLSQGPPPARWRAVAAGAWGAGGRDPEGYANALRLIVATPAHEAGELVILVTDLDDLSPEYLDPVREALFAAGALDVQVWATQSKKGRTGFRMEATTAPADAERVAEALLRHSTTAGLRRWTAERVTLPRREVAVQAADGTSVRVKIVEAPGGARAKPEYDDVAAIARRTGRPAHEVARELQGAALRLAGRAGKTTGDPD